MPKSTSRGIEVAQLHFVRYSSTEQYEVLRNTDTSRLNEISCYAIYHVHDLKNKLKQLFLNLCCMFYGEKENVITGREEEEYCWATTQTSGRSWGQAAVAQVPVR